MTDLARIVGMTPGEPKEELTVEIEIPIHHAGQDLVRHVRVNELGVASFSLPFATAVHLWTELGQKLSIDTDRHNKRIQEQDFEIKRLQTDNANLRRENLEVARVSWDLQAKVAKLKSRDRELKKRARKKRLRRRK